MTLKQQETNKALQSLLGDEPLNPGRFVPMSKWGKDHWNLLLYLGCRVVDNEGFVNRLHMRDKNRSGWEKSYGTILHGYFDNKNDRTLKLEDHDDFDCLNDIESEGLVVCATETSGYVGFTAKGREFEASLRDFKGKGGQCSGFPDSDEHKATRAKWILTEQD